MAHVLTEYSQISDTLFVGTNLCCQDHASRLHELGAQVDISLEAERVDLAHGFESSIWMPVEDHQAPTMCQLDIGTAAIVEAEARGYRVYLHCKNGHGRSPTMAIAFYIRKGMSLEEAEAVVRKGRPEINPTAAQYERLKEFEKKRKP
jgi:dual specificity MAP kinase phosphatase